MTLKSYIWGMRIVTLFSVMALILVVIYVDPESAGFLGKAIFFLLLFLILNGLFNLFFIRLRKNMINRETGLPNVTMSFRQAMLLALFTVGLLIMQGFRVLIWWDGLLLLAGIFIIELYFLSRN
jgi:hypothetical protein